MAITDEDIHISIKMITYKEPEIGQRKGTRLE